MTFEEFPHLEALQISSFISENESVTLRSLPSLRSLSLLGQSMHFPQGIHSALVIEKSNWRERVSIQGL